MKRIGVKPSNVKTKQMNPQILIPFIPITFFITVSLMIYRVVEQENQTKRKMIEAGMNPNDQTKTKRRFGFGALKAGALMIGLGLGLFLAKLLEDIFHIANPEAIYFGLILIFGGAGLLIAHKIARKQEQEDEMTLQVAE